jgi:hypothetical protein
MEHVKNTLIKLAREALALEVEEGEQAGTLAFMARFLIQATVPDSKSNTPYSQRRLRLVERKGMANAANLKPSAPATSRKLHIVRSQSRFGNQPSIPPHPPQDRF